MDAASLEAAREIGWRSGEADGWWGVDFRLWMVNSARCKGRGRECAGVRLASGRCLSGPLLLPRLSAGILCARYHLIILAIGHTLLPVCPSQPRSSARSARLHSRPDAGDLRCDGQVDAESGSPAMGESMSSKSRRSPLG